MTEQRETIGAWELMLSHGFRVRFKIFRWAVGWGSALFMGYMKGIHAGN